MKENGCECIISLGMFSYGCVWNCMALYAFLWMCMEFYGFVWFLMDVYGVFGFVCFHIVVY